MPTIGLLCISAIADDPRVRRQGDLLKAAGYEVIAVGLPGARSPPPGWPCLSVGETEGRTAEISTAGATSKALTLSAPAVNAAARRRLMRGAARRVLLPTLARIRRVADLALVAMNRRQTLDVFWRLNSCFGEVCALADGQKVDLWLANDWTTLPIAMKLAREAGVPFAYDTHELAVDEYAQDLKWRLTQRPVIAGVERFGIAGASFVTCVSQGIANRLHELYRLQVPPTVVRNMPNFVGSAHRSTGQTIRALYHGVVSPGRALEECIASVADWRPEFSLTIRGPGDPAYVDSLRRIAREHQVETRVIFAPPVPMTRLVAEAQPFDVGLFAIKSHSAQNEHVLPNKFFEYTMAGLALCVSDLPEMTALLTRHRLGMTIPRVTPQAIAETVNALDRVSIDQFKHNALEAARELCWEHEGRKLLTLIEQALAAHRRN